MRMTSLDGPDDHHDGMSAEQMLAWSRRMSVPDNELPASVPFTAVLGRTDEVAVALVGSHVYSTGFTVDLVVRLRTTPRGSMHHRLFEIIGGHGADSAQERLMLGVEYADGRTATNLNGFVGPGDGAASGDELVLSPGGGGGGGRSYDQSYWCSPVPPPGELTFVCAWPAFDIAETRAVVDATAIADAAQRAVLLWPPTPEESDVEDPPAPPNVPEGWFSRAVGRRRGS